MGRITGAGLTALAVAAWAGSVLAAAPVYREIKDWVLACDNTRACVAKFVRDEMQPAPAEGDVGYLEIARDGGPGGRLTLVLQGAEHTPDPAGFCLDGKALASHLPWRRDDGEQTAALKGVDAAAFIQAVRNGSLLTYACDTANPPWVSLKGMTAALLAMDEAQGRVGGVTAISRKGAAPASAVPPADPEPVVHARFARTPLAEPKAFAAAVRKSQKALIEAHNCEPPSSHTDGAQDEAFAINDGEAIAVLACGQFAYQSSVLLFRAPRTAPERARPVIFPAQPTVDPKLVADQGGEYVEGEWDPKAASFSEHAKGRGLGDCGESSTWTFDGKDFQLTEFRSLPRCGGGPAAGDWPVIYRAKVVFDR